MEQQWNLRSWMQRPIVSPKMLEQPERFFKSSLRMTPFNFFARLLCRLGGFAQKTLTAKTRQLGACGDRAGALPACE